MKIDLPGKTAIVTGSATTGAALRVDGGIA